MLKFLEQIQPDAIYYRVTVGNLCDPGSAEDWRQRFLDVLIAASRLYLDYLLVLKHLSQFQALSIETPDANMIKTNAVREKAHRERLKEQLASSLVWQFFSPEHPFSSITRLHTWRDYEDSLTLHLPEIYEETFRAEVLAQKFLFNKNASVLAQLAMSMEHLGHNHISFVLQTLQGLADEASWSESPVTVK